VVAGSPNSGTPTAAPQESVEAGPSAKKLRLNLAQQNVVSKIQALINNNKSIRLSTLF